MAQAAADPNIPSMFHPHDTFRMTEYTVNWDRVWQLPVTVAVRDRSNGKAPMGVEE